MVGKNSPLIRNAVIIGALTAVSSAVLFIHVLNNLWWSLQESFSHAMFHRLEDIVVGAQYIQGLSLLIVLPMVAGALTVYFSRSAIESNKDAARAGAFTGLVIACTFSLAAMILFIFVSVGTPDNSGYLLANTPFILTVSLVFPAIVIIPSAAAGAWALKRNLSNVEGAVTHGVSLGKALLIATVAAAVLVGLFTALISRNYGLAPVIPALCAIPLLFTLSLLAAATDTHYKKGTMPVAIVILALSVIAIVVLPLAGVFLACQTGIISAEPYDWEHPPVPDVYMLVVQNISSPVEDLANNLSQKNGFDWGMSLWQGDEVIPGIVESVNVSNCDLGVIMRALRPGEAALDINQTIIASDGTGKSIVFITKGERSANVTRFIDFALSEDGQDILANYGFAVA